MGRPGTPIPPLSYTLLLLCLLCPGLPAYAQAGPFWEDLNLFGGQINALAAHARDAGRLYAGSWDGNGLFQSLDSGAFWTAVPSEADPFFKNMVVYDIALDPHSPDTIWVASDDLIAVSRDAGQTWQSFDWACRQRRLCFAIAVDPHDPAGDTIYAGTGGLHYADCEGAVFKTTDAGLSWHQTSLHPLYNIVDLQVSPHLPGYVWAVSNPYQAEPRSQICLSIDAGNTWATWSFDCFIDELALHPGDQDHIFAAASPGVLRKNAAWRLLEPADVCSALCFSAAAPFTLYAGFGSSVGKTSDLGLTWSYAEAPGSFLCLASDPLGGPALYAGHENRGVFKSCDSAASWQQCNAGIRANAAFAFAISAADNTTVLAGTLAGVYRSTDNGSWHLLNSAPAEAVAFHPVQPDTLYAGLAWTIAKSSDGGRSWHEVPIADDPEAHGVSSISISAPAPERVYAGICFYSGRKGCVLASSDGGLSYRMVLQESAPVSCVVAHPSKPEVVYAATGSFFEPVIPGTVYKSTDYGATWSALALSGSVVNSLAVSANDPDLIYAACGAYDGSTAGIFLSSDGGATWRPSDSGLPLAATGTGPSAAVTRIALDPHNANWLAASLFEHGVYISLDAGTYWFAISPVDYHIYTVSLRSAGDQKARAARAQAVGRAPSVLAGTSHGAYQYATAGSGLLTGTVSSDADGPIDNAAITASCGGHCLSSSGYYLLMLPAGSHTLTASAPGYATSMHAGLLIQSGQTATCDIKLHHQAGASTCIIERLLPGSPHAPRLARLRHFRDRVLRTFFWGEGLIRIYYAISAKLCSLYG